MSDGLSEFDMDYFLSTARQDVIAAREALLDVDGDKISDIVSRVESMNVTKLIVNKANTSMSYFDEFIERMERASPGMKIIAGLSLVGAGAILWGSGSALATVIAFGLILYGIIVTIPAAIELVSIAANDLFESIMRGH